MQLIKVDQELLSKSTITGSYPGNNVEGENKGIDSGNGSHVLGTEDYNLILHEVWFVTMISAIAILLIVIFSAIICIKRRKSFLKNSLGSYNGKLKTLNKNLMDVGEFNVIMTSYLTLHVRKHLF